MSDDRKVLTDSFGMPLYWIFDKQGNSITMEDNFGDIININQMITKFNYKYDEENDEYLIARDPIGVIPLYIGHDKDGKVYCASELKALEAKMPPGYQIQLAGTAGDRGGVTGTRRRARPGGGHRVPARCAERG